MSSNIRLEKVCEYCKLNFIAKTTVTRCCSDACAKRLYKMKKRDEMLEQAKLEIEIKNKPSRHMSVMELQLIQSKNLLNLKEAAFLLDVSPLTLRRWTLSGKVKGRKVGRKLIFRREELLDSLIC